MRFYEISSGVRLPVNEEEQAILDRAIQGQLNRGNPSEREQEVARLMVTRGLLNRKRDDDGVYYTPNSVLDLWRY